MAEPASSSDRDRDPELAERDRQLFDTIARDYCRKDLHPASIAARRQRLRRTLADVPVGDTARILEVGCGAGFSARYLAGHFREFVGIDYSQSLIDYARRYNAGTAVRFDAVSVFDFKDNEPFDLIVMIGVIHHIDRMEEALRHMVGLLRPGGWLAANEPQPGNPLIRAARAERKRIDPTYSNEQAQLSARQLRELFVAAGMVNVRVRPQGLFSTPFAEVVLPTQVVATGLARLSCWADTAVETVASPLLSRLSWNLVAVGQRPER